MSTLSATLVLVPVMVLVLVSLVIVSHDGHADMLGHAGDSIFVDDEEHVVAGDCLGRYRRRMDGQLTFASVLLKGELDVTDVRGLTVSRQPGADQRHSLDPSPFLDFDVEVLPVFDFVRGLLDDGPSCEAAVIV